MRIVDGNASSTCLRLAGAAGAAVCLAYAARLTRFAFAVRDAARHARAVQPYSRRLGMRAPTMLLLGDSLAVGIGARKPCDTIAGLLAADFPAVSIVNCSRSGARTAELVRQLEAARMSSAGAAAIWISAGGNDALFNTAPAMLHDQLAAALQAGRKSAQTIVVTVAANLGLAPLFFWPLDRILSRRMRRVREVYRRVCREEGVQLVDFFQEAQADPFSRDPQRFFGSDGLHPSSECYRHCYQEILAQTDLRAALEAAVGQRRRRHAHCHPVRRRTEGGPGVPRAPGLLENAISGERA
jgi:lysophospholipase L1-like esterase